MVDHATIDIVQSQFMLPEAVQMIQTAVLDHLLSHYGSLINDVHDKHHMNGRDVHFGKYESGHLLWDIYLCQIWNLQTRMGVML